jgi:hypothetical protein
VGVDGRDEDPYVIELHRIVYSNATVFPF